MDVHAIGIMVIAPQHQSPSRPLYLHRDQLGEDDHDLQSMDLINRHIPGLLHPLLRAKSFVQGPHDNPALNRVGRADLAVGECGNE